MKDINYCLDYLLKHLHDNRFMQEGQRIPFDVDHNVMPALQLKTHEEFKGLIDLLVEDKNAFFIDGKNFTLEDYQKNVMISVRGVKTYQTNGYQGIENRQKALDYRVHQNTQRTLLLLLLTAFGTLVAAVYYVYELTKNCDCS